MRAKTVNESNSFIKSQDPKVSLGIGAWKKGYIIDKEPADIIKNRIEFGYYRVYFQGDEWNFSKGESDPDEVSQTEVSPEMELVLDVLPVVTFKYYDNTEGFLGLFGDWPEDFPFIKTSFIANCLEEEDRTFLIEPEGFNYARYSTELI